jgi:hypothetical protein
MWEERSAISPHAVDSTALGAAGWKPNPPSEFWLVTRNSWQYESRSGPDVIRCTGHGSRDTGYGTRDTGIEIRDTRLTANSELSLGY